MRIRQVAGLDLAQSQYAFHSRTWLYVRTNRRALRLPWPDDPSHSDQMKAGSHHGRSRYGKRLLAIITAVLLITVTVEVSNSQASQTWERVSDPVSGSASLLEVSCVSETHCVAVGVRQVDGVFRVLAAGTSDSGTTWTVHATPDLGANAQLEAVSCADSTHCIAVGSYEDIGGYQHALILRTTDGSSWSALTSPVTDSDGEESRLYGVSCTSTTSCQAVGQVRDTSGIGHTLAIRMLDGTNWSVRQSPSPGTTHSVLSSVACVSSSRCVAVGRASGGDAVSESLILQTSNAGGTWSQILGPSYPDNEVTLNGVSCIGSYCAAVGYRKANSIFRNLIITSTNGGVNWNAQESPNLGAQNLLLGVSCYAAGKCAAVGVYTGDLRIFPAVQTTTNGTHWEYDSIVNPGVAGELLTWQENYLYGVSCASATACLAVGETTLNENIEVLVERIKPQQVPASPSPAPADKQNQTAKCLIVPAVKGKKSLKKSRTAALTKRDCRTSTGTQVTVSCKTAKKQPKVKCRSVKGVWRITPPARRTKVTITWSAPGSASHRAFTHSIVRKT